MTPTFHHNRRRPVPLTGQATARSPRSATWRWRCQAPQRVENSIHAGPLGKPVDLEGCHHLVIRLGLLLLEFTKISAWLPLDTGSGSLWVLLIEAKHSAQTHSTLCRVCSSGGGMILTQMRFVLHIGGVHTTGSSFSSSTWRTSWTRCLTNLQTGCWTPQPPNANCREYGYGRC